MHHTHSGEGPPVVLLHGLFGSGNNLGGLGRALQDSRSVYAVDLPNHGRSGWQGDATLATMADSVGNWMSHQGIMRAQFVGHSLGGKVAMQLALAQPRLVSAVVVADIAPVDYPPGHDSVFAALDAVAAGRCVSRSAAAELMSVHLQEQQVIQFLLTSLRRDADGLYRWRFNLEGLKRGYAAAWARPGAAGTYPGPVLFIKGGESNYIREEHRSHILSLFPQATMKIMPGCGHWLHAERPSLFNSLVRRFLLEQPN
ncbi:MAG: alpha/beta fold hydrolase [Pseudomonadales bacterium]|nr:alpha/beta fold hydrolase [Pseudomonadales bacterium]